jgi:class 3 adenylate cyclase
VSTTRRLAAILAADVAGYSRLMGADEEGTLAALKAIRRELGDPKVKEHRGRIVKTTGDGLLVEFASVVDAVRCAVEVQQGLAERNADVPQEKRIEFRIGINLGDVIRDGRDIFGDGVNIAARLEALADPGGICVSRVVHDQVRDKLDLGLRGHGRAASQEHCQASACLAPPARRETGGIRVGATGIARQAVDRGVALCQHERRSRAGLFRRRDGRGDHHCALAHPLALRDRLQFELHLQRPGDRREAGRPRVGCPLRPRRFGP